MSTKAGSLTEDSLIEHADGGEPDPGLVARVLPWVMPFVAVCLLGAVLYGVCVSRTWPFVHDVPLFHYIVFLMDSGRAPYKDIIDVNMPGTYMIEWVVVHGFGAGAEGLWRADTLTGVVVVMSAVWIAGPGRRWAGLAGGALAYLSHLGEGPTGLCQRDWFVAVLSLAGAGCLAGWLRHRKDSTRNGLLIFGFTMCLAMAALVKPPTAIVAAVVVVGAVAHARRAGRNALRVLAWSMAGALVPLFAAGVFLARWSALPAFLDETRTFLPWYAAQHQLSLRELLLRIVPFGFGLLTPLVLIIFVAGRLWRDPRLLLPACGTLAGAFVFLVQRKGWGYHLALEMVFLSVFCMFTLDRGLLRRGMTRWVSLACVLVLLLPVMRVKLRAVRRASYPLSTITQLNADLTEAGGARLSGDVQCLDETMGGCINVLYQLRLLQATSSIYDIYLFPQKPTAWTVAMQARFLREMEAHPPKLIVLSSHIWPADRNGYDELANWPVFAAWLTEHYHLSKEQPVPTDSAAGYRIYQRS